MQKTEFHYFLEAQGYDTVLRIGDKWIAINTHFFFTTAILGGVWGDTRNVDLRFCYEDEIAARRALLHWLVERELQGRPEGYVKEKSAPSVDAATYYDVRAVRMARASLYDQPEEMNHAV